MRSARTLIMGNIVVVEETKGRAYRDGRIARADKIGSTQHDGDELIKPRLRASSVALLKTQDTAEDIATLAEIAYRVPPSQEV